MREPFLFTEGDPSRGLMHPLFGCICYNRFMKFKDLPNSQAILIVDEGRKEISDNFWAEINEEKTPNIFINKTVIDIETIREIISWANTPFNGDKTCLISFHTITLPAQNSALKLLEEIKPGVGFILITSNEEALIPTILSRLHKIYNKSKVNRESLASEFFKTKPVDRMKLKSITELLGKEDEEKRKDRESVKSFLSDLILFGKENDLEGDRLIKLIEIENYAGDPSSSGKVLIEFLSLYLPQIK